MIFLVVYQILSGKVVINLTLSCLLKIKISQSLNVTVGILF